MKLTEFKKLIREEVRKVISEAATPKPGSTIDDYDLINKKIIKSKHEEDWLELFSDEPELTSGTNKRLTKLANSWLEKNGYTWRVEKAISQNEDGEITWKIK